MRCPKCAALVAPGAAWCSLCYLDLRPPAPEPKPVAVEPEPVPVRVPDLGPDGTDATSALLVANGPRRGKHARRAPEPTPDAGPDTSADAAQNGGLTALDESAESAARELLAALEQENRLPTQVSSAVAQLDSTGAKVVVMVGGLVLVSLLMVGLMALVGSFL